MEVALRDRYGERVGFSAVTGDTFTSGDLPWRSLV
jgi:hypothetical protein